MNVTLNYFLLQELNKWDK